MYLNRYFYFKMLIAHKVYLCTCVYNIHFNCICERKCQHHFFENSYIKQDRIAGIHSFGNKSIANVFGLFLSIFVFKMSLAYFYSPSP